jgi:hypothetical protein
MKETISVATLYKREPPEDFPLVDMAWIRWIRMSQQLAGLGFEVDIIANSTSDRSVQVRENVRFVPFSQFEPCKYDVVKTLFHRGYESLALAGGERHPFIISKLGSVVGSNDTIAGVHFFGDERRWLYELQQRMHEHSRYITILTEQSKKLWELEFGRCDNVLLIPTGVDSHTTPPHRNPYREFQEKIAVYIGNLYTEMQKEVNLFWQRRLNSLGGLLKKKGIRLCVIGPGRTNQLDAEAVTYLGAVENERVWDYHYFADVGVALAQGSVQHNESSKIYYYIRAGLPVVSEAPIPNNFLIEQSGLGFIAEYGDDRMMAELIERAVQTEWPRKKAVAYMLEHHTWEKRAAVYGEIIRGAFGV